MLYPIKKNPEYYVWRGMKSRCYNKNNPSYKNYGGRGIQVCDEWRNSFLTFFADVGPRPTPRHSIDRIDNGNGYEPSNVRWATWCEQALNRRPAIRFRCKNGHLLTGSNVIEFENGRHTRRCRICRNAGQRRQYALTH